MPPLPKRRRCKGTNSVENLLLVYYEKDLSAMKLPRQTPRLLLSPLRESDIPLIVRYAGDPAVAGPTLNIPHPYERAAAEGWIKATKEGMEAGEQYTLAIRQPTDEALLGAVGLTLVPRHARAALGYWLARPFWGQGYMTEAVGEMIRFGFEELDLNKIYATHLIENPASGRVMQKNHMIKEGELLEHYQKGDQYRSVFQYRILRSEYERRSI